ncbi:MarR family transcriptional regulator [Actinocorallia sp. B10E7]|uniref:MarR family winged helix-turn-helix transcriptional regulator n=1 Tax=Actinocorallia sp. B10E7 TaxID=3153558 RepID=UPI00325F243C
MSGQELSPVEAVVLDAVESAMIRIRRRQSRRSLARTVLQSLDVPMDLNTLTVIDAIDEARDPQDVTVGFVADRLAVDPSRASRIVAEAVKAGFVRRVASQEDGRRSCLELTPAGRLAIDTAHRTRQTFYAGLLEDWSPEDRKEFARLLTRFARALDEE